MINWSTKMLKKIINTIHSINLFIDEIKHISISQWDVEHNEESDNGHQKY
jgi:hypothetical protein